MFLHVPERRIAPVAQDWVAWLRSVEAQRIVRRAGFVDRGAAPIPLALHGDRLAQAITSAGPETSLSELQGMLHKLTPRMRLTTTFRFNAGSAMLDAQSRSNLRQLATWLAKGEMDGHYLTLIGFSDGRGAAAENLALSMARAESVRLAVTELLGGAVPETVTLDVDAFGEALPMGCDDTIWGRQTNRRVELWIDRALPTSGERAVAVGSAGAP